MWSNASAGSSREVPATISVDEDGLAVENFTTAIMASDFSGTRASSSIEDDGPIRSEVNLAPTAACVGQAQPASLASSSADPWDLSDHKATLLHMQQQFDIMQRSFLSLRGFCEMQMSRLESEQAQKEAQRRREQLLIRRYHSSIAPQQLHRGEDDHSADCSWMSPTLATSLNHEEGTLSGEVGAGARGGGGGAGGVIIKLNIGGVRFNAYHSTLTRFPGTMFDVLLSGSLPVDLDEKGYIFIDRDPDLFRELLYFLRTGDSRSITMQPELQKRRILEEAKYFGIDELVTELKCHRGRWTSETEKIRLIDCNMPQPRCFAAAQYVGNDTVYFFGGCTSNDTFFNALYRLKITQDPLPLAAGGAALSDDAASDAGGSAGCSTTRGGSSGRPSGPIDDDTPSLDDMASTKSNERYELSCIRPKFDVFPTPRSGHSLLYLSGHLLLLCGNDKSTHVQDCFMYNIFAQVWTPLVQRGDPVGPRSGQTATLVNGKIFIIGGKQLFPVVKCYGDILAGTVDITNATISWQLVQPVTPTNDPCEIPKRTYHSAAAYGHLLYVFGGIVRDQYCRELCCFNTETCVWKTFQPGDPPRYVPAFPRSGHIAIIHKDEMYVFGSYSEEGSTMQLVALSLRTFQWRVVETGGKAPSRRAAPSAVLLPRSHVQGTLPRLLIFGGFDIHTRKCFNDLFTITL